MFPISHHFSFTKGRDRMQSKKRGSVLLMSIIISSGIMIVGIEFSLFVVSSLNQQKNIDQTLIAQSASESGVEDALEQIRHEGRTTLRNDSLTSPESVYADNAWGGTWTFKNTSGGIDPAKFNTSISQLTKIYLPEQQSVDVDLYTQSASGFSSPTGGQIQNMVVSWDGQDCQATGDTAWIETTATFWPINGSQVDWSQSTVKKDYEASSAANPYSITVDLLALSGGGSLAGKGMTLRIKPFYCSLHNVKITFPSSTDNTTLLPIPNYYLIKPAGLYGSTQKDVQVIAPQTSALSNIFDFTIFSNDQLTKSSGL